MKPRNPVALYAAYVELMSRRSEAVFALLIAISTILFATASMYYARYAAIIATQTTEKSNSYLWYQAKSLRENQSQSLLELINVFLDAGILSPDARPLIEKHVQRQESEILRYSKEKKEILLGSQTVGKDNWIQEIDGELGKIVGAKEMEAVVNQYSDGFTAYEWACLLLQISLGIGTVGLVLTSPGLKSIVGVVMILLCILCTHLCIVGYVSP